VRLSRLRLLLFTLVCGAALVFLSWYSPLTLTKNPVDRHTGQEIDEDGIPVTRMIGVTADDVLESAREMGDARLALAHIRVNRAEVRNPAGLLRTTNALTAELSPLADLVERAKLEGAPEWLRCEEARGRLGRAPKDPPRFEEALDLLRALELEDGSGEAVEGFFQPLGSEWDAGEDLVQAVQRYAPPDRIAAVALSRAEGEVADVAAEDCLLVGRAFRSAARPRARFRWLLRAFAADPSSAEVVEMVAGTYLEYGRQLEAFVVLTVATEEGADGDELWRMLASVAGWTSAVRTEA